ncbi:YtxH domain-containing protein [Cohnella cellulosilytica]|uniref:YtxH domain-containing protein n=1 Tax=Cohnella cellulosilytica TaxID=986710 RepID=A0ABW2F525_9BACL
MAETKQAVKGIVIGGIIGAAAALLLAPKSGKELRKDIRVRYSSVQDRTKQLVSDAGSKTLELAQQVGRKTADLADKTRSIVAGVQEEIQEQGAKALDSVRNGSMVHDFKDMQKMGKEMKQMKTESELEEDGLVNDPIQNR